MSAPIGDNTINKEARGRLQSFLERAEAIIDNEIEPAKLALKEVMAEAKADGFQTKALREIVRRRAKDRAKLQEENAILALYAHALGLEDLV